MTGPIDKNAEIARLLAIKLEQNIQKLDCKLSNTVFVDKAPSDELKNNAKFLRITKSL